MSAVATESKTNIALTLFNQDEFEDLWPQLERTLDSVPHTWRHWTKPAIYDAILADRMQVWGAGQPPKATYIFFTVVNVFPAAKVLAVVWAAGEYKDDMMPLLDATLTNYAELNECDEIEVRGRLGWEPKLKQIGFKHVASVWARPVKRHSIN